MSEWSIVPSWKGGVVKATSGSNPDLCAIIIKIISKEWLMKIESLILLEKITKQDWLLHQMKVV